MPRRCKGDNQKAYDDLRASAKHGDEPRLAYDYAQDRLGGADVPAGRSLQRRTRKVMRVYVVLGSLLIVAAFVVFFVNGLLTGPSLVIACVMFSLSILLVLAIQQKYSAFTDPSAENQRLFDKLYRTGDGGRGPITATSPILSRAGHGFDDHDGFDDMVDEL